MPAAQPLPRSGSVFFDTRGDERALRVSWHGDAGLVVLSLWRFNVCVASFRLPTEDVPPLIDALSRGLDRAGDTPLAI